MKIAVIGAGNIGKVIISEALSRGHQVTAVVRDPAKLTLSHAALSVTCLLYTSARVTVEIRHARSSASCSHAVSSSQG